MRSRKSQQRLVLGRRRRELAKVLQARVRLVAVLGAQRVAHTGLAHDGVDHLARREVVGQRAQLVEEEREAVRAGQRAPGEAGGTAVARGLGEGEPVFGRVDAELGLGGRTHAALGLVDHAARRRLVARVHDEPRVGQRVLDLLAVVEAHAPTITRYGMLARSISSSSTRLCALVR